MRARDRRRAPNLPAWSFLDESVLHQVRDSAPHTHSEAGRASLTHLRPRRASDSEAASAAPTGAVLAAAPEPTPLPSAAIARGAVLRTPSDLPHCWWGLCTSGPGQPEQVAVALCYPVIGSDIIDGGGCGSHGGRPPARPERGAVGHRRRRFVPTRGLEPPLGSRGWPQPFLCAQLSTMAIWINKQASPALPPMAAAPCLVRPRSRSPSLPAAAAIAVDDTPTARSAPGPASQWHPNPTPPLPSPYRALPLERPPPFLRAASAQRTALFEAAGRPQRPSPAQLVGGCVHADAHAVSREGGGGVGGDPRGDDYLPASSRSGGPSGDSGSSAGRGGGGGVGAARHSGCQTGVPQ